MLDFGVEIECLVPSVLNRVAVAAAISEAGIPCYDAGYSHAFEATRWKVVSDGSVTGPGNGMELVSPPLTEAGFEQIEKVSAVLLRLGATVNRSCGLHVHIGARNHSVASLKKLAAIYIEHEPVIDQLLPTSRRGSANNFCESITAANWGQLARATSVSDIAIAVTGMTDVNARRNVKLNYQSYWRHGTVEFRHHSGTVDAAKIIKWVVFCSKLVEAAVREAHEPFPMPANSPTQYSGYWQRGRRTRRIFQMLTRLEGATAEEIRLALGVRSRPNVRWHLNNANGPAERNALTRSGRRNRHEVFKLSPATAAAVAPRTPPTLEGLYEKLGLSDEDKAFWAARASHLAQAGLEHNP